MEVNIAVGLNTVFGRKRAIFGRKRSRISVGGSLDGWRAGDFARMRHNDPNSSASSCAQREPTIAA